MQQTETYRDVRFDYGESTIMQRSGESHYREQLSKADPAKFEANVQAMRDRWRRQDLPALLREAQARMQAFFRSPSMSGRQHWRDVECEIYDAEVACGLRDHAKSQTTAIAQSMDRRSRGRLSKMNMRAVPA